MKTATLKPTAESIATGVAERRTAPNGLVPIVIGVTGHLDLNPGDRDKLEEAVRTALNAIRAQDAERPMVLLTPLARGADTLVARIALSMEARLVVPLPLPREEYRQDFASDDRSAFDELLDDPGVARCIELPEIGGAALTLAPQVRRELQYALAGAYVARHCDVLIALWDGVWSDKVGGTAQVVQYRRAGSFVLEPALLECLAAVPEPFQINTSLLDPPDVGTVYHIVTPRRDRRPPADAFTHKVLLPYASSDPAQAPAHHLAARIREFNRDALALDTSDPARIERSWRQLYPETGGPSDDTSALPAGLAGLGRSFALADALSVRYRRASHGALFSIFTLIFVAAVAFAFFADGFRADQIAASALIGAYVTILALADAFFVFVMVRRWQDKHQDYRAVAEGLRVQFYWRLAGLPHSAADHYVRKQRDELTWIPHTVRACSTAAPVMTGDKLGMIRSLWVAGQADYYDTARARAQRSVRWRHAGSGSFVVSLLLGLLILSTYASDSNVLRVILLLAAGTILAHAVALMLGRLGGDNVRAERTGRAYDILAGIAGFAGASVASLLLIQVPEWLPARAGWIPADPSQWLKIALALTAVAGALLHGYAEVRAFAEHARHYGRLAAVFQRANDRLRALLDARQTATARALIIELGKEALTDHGDWVMLHRERPIELPEAGG